jgi:hypothetical protein
MDQDIDFEQPVKLIDDESVLESSMEGFTFVSELPDKKPKHQSNQFTSYLKQNARSSPRRNQ